MEKKYISLNKFLVGVLCISTDSIGIHRNVMGMFYNEFCSRDWRGDSKVRELADVSANLSSVPSTCIERFTMTCISSFRVSHNFY